MSYTRMIGVSAAFVLVVCVSSARAEASRTVEVCADFTIFPDDHKFKDTFTLAAFKFKKLGGTVPLFVNESGGDRGLQFPKEGLEVTLPTPVRTVDLTIGTFAGDVKIEALNKDGKVILTQTAKATNKFDTVSLNAMEEIASVKFTGGGNEGNLASICVKLNVAP